MIQLLALMTLLAAADGGMDRPVEVPVPGTQIVLAGTLTTPPAADMAVVLLPVAGPTDRDLTLGPKRFFGEFSRALATEGIASLRLDDRGVGGSGGNWLETSFEDRGRDACAAMATLKNRVPDASRRGFVGISEGGALALFADAECAASDFVVLLSTPLNTGRQTMAAQLERALDTMPGLTPERRQSLEADATSMLDLVQSEDDATAVAGLTALLEGPNGRLLVPPYGFVPHDPAAKVEFLRSNWYRSQVSYDVAPWLTAGQAPVLALYGSLDQVIDASRSLEALRGSGRNAEAVMLPGLNHLLQAAVTGSPLEYMALEGTFAPGIVDHVVGWLRP